MMANTRSGFIALIGRPNVGKSTLLNQILGRKLSITSRKPQTTRHKILGIKTIEKNQLIFIDTPGLHEKNHSALNKLMNKAARSAIHDVDMVIFLVVGTRWLPEDQLVLDFLKKSNKPVILAVNKIDLLQEKAELLPHLKVLSEKFAFVAMVPISAEKNLNIEVLEKTIIEFLPEAPFYFEKNQITDRSERFFAAEILREKLMRNLGKELPYETTVVIEKFAKEKNILHIHALIYVDSAGQKKILIGEKGEKLKQIASSARIDLEKRLGEKIFLKVWIKVKRGWSDDLKSLENFGYEP